MRGLRRLIRSRGDSPPEWVPVATGPQHVAEMLTEILVQEGVPAYVRSLDVSAIPTVGACHVCVPADRALEARAIVDPMASADGGWE